ncbi:hypothetical protein G3545_08750 [Starkeya sp. ORNL1]|uniref:hypothetical protein n=1 Tax=Starkeya sp. ORNL1 TaxID=2709380 RepID=UPI00146310CF|nr:hypothetical protein [Starkeya sp. ORNL1]QJP13738.1 hypothetical protein G3545_08750 [Starkeya sp. ORNL1]
MYYARRQADYWHAKLPEPIRPRRGRPLTTLSDASAYIDGSFPVNHRGESVHSVADALRAGAESGDKADIEFAATMLRRLLTERAA